MGIKILFLLCFVLLKCSEFEAKGGGGRGGGGFGSRGSFGTGSRGGYGSTSKGGGLFSGWFKSSPAKAKTNSIGWNVGNNRASYGQTFGSRGLGQNTYIGNNYYGGGSRFGGGGSSFLTYFLLFRAGQSMGHGGYGGYGNQGYGHRSWNAEDDQRWRATTKAPYFENKIPGSEEYLPAAAVVGAATAFGVTTLLPLNVPAGKPLMYCNNTDVAQSQIKIDDDIYSCLRDRVVVSCVLETSPDITKCLMECDANDKPADDSESLYCNNSTLVSQSPLVCNSTTVVDGINGNETMTILNCYYGSLSEAAASFIPTTTEIAVKELSMEAQIHVFFMKLIGKSDVIEKARATTEAPNPFLNETETRWVPEPLTLPPELLSTTTEDPFEDAFMKEFD